MLSTYIRINKYIYIPQQHMTAARASSTHVSSSFFAALHVVIDASPVDHRSQELTKACQITNLCRHRLHHFLTRLVLFSVLTRLVAGAVVFLLFSFPSASASSAFSASLFCFFRWLRYGLAE